MRLVKSKNANINYLAKVVYINDFHPHPDEEVNKLKCAYVDGYNIIIGIDEQPGKFIYFPTNSRINPQFLSFANLYRHGELNSNPEKTGMFEDNGRVKTIKLRGCLSEGFLLPIQVFLNWIYKETQIELPSCDIENGTEFDTIEHNGKTFWVNKKYIVRQQNSSYRDKSNVKKAKGFNKVIPEFFPLHYDTELIKKVANAINPDDLIHLSSKIHGTSGRFGYVLCRRKLNLFRKIINLCLGKSWNSEWRYYDYLYGSRQVVKNATSQPGFYKSDPWGPAFEVIKPHLIKGMNIYAEIVGFTPDGSYIQKDYDYGCEPPINGEYVHEKNFKVRVYRITITNEDGVLHEFSPREVQIWCTTHNLVPVTEFYYGYAKDLYKDLDVNDEDWYHKFLERMANDTNFYMEKKSPDCINNVPQEGIVIKIDNMKSAAFKLKTFAFLNGEQKELDKGISNIEDEN